MEEARSSGPSFHQHACHLPVKAWPCSAHRPDKAAHRTRRSRLRHVHLVFRHTPTSVKCLDSRAKGSGTGAGSGSSAVGGGRLAIDGAYTE